MKSSYLLITLAGFSLLLTGSDWLQFRGPDGKSHAPKSKCPTKLDVEESVAWKAKLPGKGPSSPIVVGDLVIVTCSGGDKQNELHTICFNKDTGKKVWHRQLWATGRCFCHPLSANAAPTPVSNGEQVFVFFSSNDLACYDLNGNLQWFRGLAVDHPRAGHDTGMSSSPVLVNGLVIVQVENQGDSFVAGIDQKSGQTVWEVKRDLDASWASPLVVAAENMRPELVLLVSPKRVSCLNASTGQTIWEKEGQANPIVSSLYVNKIVLLPINGTTAYQFEADGRLTEIWNAPQLRASNASFVCDDRLIYTLNRGGVLTASDLQNGKAVWKKRIGGSYWSTPVLSSGFLYFFNQDGVANVVDTNNEGEIVSTAKFGEAFLASPAISDSSMYVRTNEHLWKLSEKPDSE